MEFSLFPFIEMKQFIHNVLISFKNTIHYKVIDYFDVQKKKKN